MKRLLCLLLSGLCTVVSCGCGHATGAPLCIAMPNGPAGMGTVVLMDSSDSGRYDITLSSTPEDAARSFQNGEVQVAAVSLEQAAALYDEMDGNAVLIAVSALNSPYILERGETILSIGDLQGKALAVCGDAASELILHSLLKYYGVTADIQDCSDPAALSALLASGTSLGVLSEPYLTAALSQNPDLRVALDLAQEWDTVSGTQLVYSGIIVRKDYMSGHEDVVRQFLTDFAASTAFVNNHHEKALLMLESHGFFEHAALTKKSIKRCNIVCITGEAMRSIAEETLQLLFDADPQSVGGTIPPEDFYYIG